MSDVRKLSHTKHFWWKLGQLHSDVQDFKLSQPGLYEGGHPLSTEKTHSIHTVGQVFLSRDCFPGRMTDIDLQPQSDVSYSVAAQNNAPASTIPCLAGTLVV